jgi:hypothetical protein
MDNVQNCDDYINIPSSQIYKSYFVKLCISVVHQCYGGTHPLQVLCLRQATCTKQAAGRQNEQVVEGGEGP